MCRGRRTSRSSRRCEREDESRCVRTSDCAGDVASLCDPQSAPATNPAASTARREASVEENRSSSNSSKVDLRTRQKGSLGAWLGYLDFSDEVCSIDSPRRRLLTPFSALTVGFACSSASTSSHTPFEGFQLRWLAGHICRRCWANGDSRPSGGRGGDGISVSRTARRLARRAVRGGRDL